MAVITERIKEAYRDGVVIEIAFSGEIHTVRGPLRSNNMGIYDCYGIFVKFGNNFSKIVSFPNKPQQSKLTKHVEERKSNGHQAIPESLEFIISLTKLKQ